MAVMFPKMLAPSEAARELGISRTRILELIDEGQLDCYRSSLGRLIAAESVER